MVWLLLQYQRLVRAGGVARRRLHDGLGGAAALPQSVGRDPPPPRQRRARGDGEDEADGTPPKRLRRHDGQLRLPARLAGWMTVTGDDGGDERPPFGDG